MVCRGVELGRWFGTVDQETKLLPTVLASYIRFLAIPLLVQLLTSVLGKA